MKIFNELLIYSLEIFKTGRIIYNCTKQKLISLQYNYFLGGFFMHINKRSTAFIAIALGAVILTTSAFADFMLGSGYHSLKSAAKTTMAKLSDEVDNFSVDTAVTIKVDDEVFIENSSSIKYDNVNNASETNSVNIEKGKRDEYYYYSDSEKSISKNADSDSYHVWNNRFDNDEEYEIFENPFDEEEVADAEKILDAFVGSLKDVIQVDEAGDKKMYTGYLSDIQIPALINAVSSYGLKYAIIDERSAKVLKVPRPKENIYVKEVSGKAIENSDGIIENIIGSASITATDEKGVEHIYSIELYAEIKDINSTTVMEPDLTGQNVDYSTNNGGFSFDEKYVGVYKNNIIEIEGSTFVKQGERFFEITSVDSDAITGRYYEEYKDGYSPDEVKAFAFSSELLWKHGSASFSYYEDGEEKTCVFYQTGQQNLEIVPDVVLHEDGGWSSSNSSEDFDGNFVRVFE